jgi:hypothetical protein
MKEYHHALAIAIRNLLDQLWYFSYDFKIIHSVTTNYATKMADALFLLTYTAIFLKLIAFITMQSGKNTSFQIIYNVDL